MIALFTTLLLAASPATAGEPASEVSKAPTVAVRVSFLESASRVKIADETVQVALDGKVATKDLAKSGSLGGMKLKTLARVVKVNDAPGGAWLELTVLAKDGSEAGYLAVTIPSGVETSGFSAATKVRGARKGEEISLVVSRP